MAEVRTVIEDEEGDVLTITDVGGKVDITVKQGGYIATVQFAPKDVSEINDALYRATTRANQGRRP